MRAALPTAGHLLLEALAKHGITKYDDHIGMSYTIPIDPNTPADLIGTGPFLTVGDHNPSVDHAPEKHTGWIVFAHDDRGEPIGEALYASGGAGPVDCVTDSARAAAAIADYLATART